MNNIYTLVIGMLCILSSSAQTSKPSKGQKAYENYAYIDVIKIYEASAKKGLYDTTMLKQLGDSYYFNAHYKDAFKWYHKLFAKEKETEIESDYVFRYAQSLKAIGNIKEAAVYFSKFSEISKDDSRAKHHNNSITNLKAIHKQKTKFTITDAGINTAYSEYGGAILNSDYIFTSTRDTGNVSKMKHSWTGKYFSNLYSAQINSADKLENVSPFTNDINSKFHESSAIYTNNGKRIYFTRNNFIQGKQQKNKDGVTLLKLYKADKINNKWTKIRELPFNSNEYNIAHPALSPDEKTLYFASDMPGTLGQSDLYKVAILGDDSYGTPVNLGPQINTEAKETFPFISENNELFFASNGHLGLGGLDLFTSKITDDDTGFSDVENLGAPINSAFDDFGYTKQPQTQNGYFTSNRPSGKGGDDIYKFTQIEMLAINYKQSINGVFVDDATSKGLTNATVMLFDSNMTVVSETTTAENGAFVFDDLKAGQNYVIRGQLKEYTSVEKGITTNFSDGTTACKLTSNKVVHPLKIGSKLSEIFGTSLIYFKSDKKTLTREDAISLSKIVEVLNNHPTMGIEIKAHTDSRYTATYNKKLSVKRAQETLNWIVAQGIERSRLTAVGVGETELLNHCDNATRCSAAEHQKNRRSEFIITSL